MTRMWSKAAILIVLSIYFGLVHAADPKGAGRQLSERLTAFYELGGRFAAVEPARYHGAAVVPVVLNAVLRHADDPQAHRKWKNRKLIAWAQQLVNSAGGVDSFTRSQLARQTSLLFAHFDDRGQARSDLMMVADRLDLWGAEHLPFLARQAGLGSAGDAEEFAQRALITLAQLDQRGGGDLRPMVKVLRDSAPDLNPAQWALLAQSGHVTEVELATVVMIVAHEFARGDGFTDFTPSLMPDEPLRAVFENFMIGLEVQDETTHSAFMMAQDQSEDVGDWDSPRKYRRLFFKHLIEHTLFDAPVTHESRSSQLASAESVSAETSADQNSTSNIVYPKFGAGPRTCAEDMSKSR